MLTSPPAAALAAVAALAACSPDAPPEPPAWTVRDSAGVAVVENARPSVPAGTWTLAPEPLLRVGRADAGEAAPDTTAVALGRPVDVRLLSGGGLLVADGRAGGWQIVFLFDDEGRLLADCGGAGDARGALGRLTWAAPWPGDSIAAYDASDHTLAIYDPFDRFGRGCRIGREVALPGSGTPSGSGTTPPSGTPAGSGGSGSSIRPGAAGARGADGLLLDGSVLVWVWADRASAEPGAGDSGADPAGGGRAAEAGTAEAPAAEGQAAEDPAAEARAAGDDVVRRHRVEMRSAPDGERVDTLGIFHHEERWRTGEGTALLPFPAVASLVPAGEGFAYASGRPFEVRLYDGSGDLRRVARRTWEPEPLTVADREAFVTWYAGRTLRGADRPPRAERERLLLELPWPESRPAVSRLVVADDGAVWVEGWRWIGWDLPPEPGPVTWSVFSPRGRWVADVVVPGRFLLTDVRGKRVAGVHVDPSGAGQVRVYELRR